MERALFRRLATTENPREPWLSGEDVRCQPSLCIVSALGEARKRWETMHDEVWKTVPSLVRAEVRRREKQKSTCRERRERPFFSFFSFPFSLRPGQVPWSHKISSQDSKCQPPKQGKRLLAWPADSLVGTGSYIPVALLWSSPFFHPSLSCLLVHLQAPATHHTNHSATHTTSCIVHSSQSPSSLPVGQALERSPQSLPRGTTPRLAPPPSPPSTTPPAPTATATVHSRPPQSVPSQPVTPQFPSSSIASPTRPDHSCLPPVARRRLCSFRPSAKEPGEPSSRLGKPLFAAAALPFRPPSTAHGPSSGATLQPLPQPPTTATSTTPITPTTTTTTTPAKTCLQSTPHPHNGGENGALQAGGAG